MLETQAMEFDDKINEITVDNTPTTPTPAVNPIEEYELAERRRRSSKRRRRSSKRRRLSSKQRKLSRKRRSSRWRQSSRRLSVAPILEHSRNYRIRKVYDVAVTFQICGLIVFYTLTLYIFPCVASDESFEDFDNLIAYVIMIVCLGCMAFSKDFQEAVPINYIYSHSSVIALSYIGAKVVCGNDMILIFQTGIIVGIEEFGVYLLSIYVRTDFTALTPVLTFIYAFTTILNIIVIHFAYDSVPVVMLNIFNSFLTIGLMLCVSQFPITPNPNYRLPEHQYVYCAFMIHSLVNSLEYHTYLLVIQFYGGL